jgi:hypothetical protein
LQQALAFPLFSRLDEGLARVGDRAGQGIGLVGGVALGVDRHPRPALGRVHAPKRCAISWESTASAVVWDRIAVSRQAVCTIATRPKSCVTP